MNKNKSKNTISVIDPGMKKAVMDGISTHSNLTQRILNLSEDKIKICLMNNIDKFEKRSGWQNPFTLLISILVTLLTSTFKDKILPKETWQAIFVMCGIFSFIWLIYALSKMKKRVTIDQIIDELAGVEIKK